MSFNLMLPPARSILSNLLNLSIPLHPKGAKPCTANMKVLQTLEAKACTANMKVLQTMKEAKKVKRKLKMMTTST